MRAHPWENGTGVCMYCGTETRVDEFIFTTVFDCDVFEGVGWACRECEIDVFGEGRGPDAWTQQERDDADRVWLSAGKAVNV